MMAEKMLNLGCDAAKRLTIFPVNATKFLKENLTCVELHLAAKIFK
jgi:hypothetical protein